MEVGVASSEVGLRHRVMFGASLAAAHLSARDCSLGHQGRWPRILALVLLSCSPFRSTLTCPSPDQTGAEWINTAETSAALITLARHQIGGDADADQRKGSDAPSGGLLTATQFCHEVWTLVSGRMDRRPGAKLAVHISRRADGHADESSLVGADALVLGEFSIICIAS